MSYQQISQEQPLEQQVAYNTLLKYGPCLQYRTDTGRTLTVLPTCTTSLDHLIEEHWDQKSREHYCGNFRNVRRISNLSDGTPLLLYTKAAEYRFRIPVLTGIFDNLIWWGGPRLVSNPTVEEQTIWEAIFLLELHKNNIRAEIPQAIVEYTGKKELIVKGIPVDYTCRPAQDQPSYDETFALIRQTGMTPIDYGGHNILCDVQGYNHVIDVNRWIWEPYTDDFRTRLLRTVLHA